MWIRALAFSSLLGCSAGRDADRDGFSAADGDCDDEDAAAYPGADEVCDGVDNNCDGAIDLDAIDARAWFADADGDGFSGDKVVTVACDAPDGRWADTPTDCDDLNPSAAPGLSEVCDGADNDCDGLVDDNDDSVDPGSFSVWYLDVDQDGYGVSDVVARSCAQPDGFSATDGDCDDANADHFPGQRWHADGDGDGYGSADDVFVACTQPDGYRAEGLDCDDTDPTIRPGAIEVCDGADNDCDDLIDDEDDSVDPDSFLVWFRDVDQDGYGVDGVATKRCGLIDGFVEQGGDCDDTSASVNPGAAEVCNNDIDDNCDGDAWPCGFTGGLLTADAGANFSTSGGNLGYDLAVGDVDGDGVDDVAVPAYASGGGIVYLQLGPVTADIALDKSADARLMGGDDYDYAGKAVDLGDHDGDGRDDILVGAYGHDTGGNLAGAAYLLYGAATLTGDRDLEVRSDLAWYGEEAGALLGSAAAFVGDLDGDGLVELALGASGAEDGDGAVFVFYGAASGTAQDLDDAGATFSAESEDGPIGEAQSASGVGDLDGDGFGELLLAAEQSDRVASDAGAAWLFYGGTATIRGNLELDDADAAFTGDEANDRLGGAAAAGDFDGDGYGDLAIAAASADPVSRNEGAVYVFGGDSTRRDDAVIAADEALCTVYGAAASDYAGAGLAAGDISGDDLDDLLVGATGVDAGSYSSAGAAYLLNGPFSGARAVADADTTVTGTASYTFVGQALVAGDLNDDGQADVILSAYGADQVHLFFGGGL